LENSFDLNGVGDIGFGVNYNNALYKVRKFAFHKLLSSLKINFEEKEVMDIGSGTGFYIDRWKELSVRSILGTDITNIAIKKLSEKYPNEIFKQLDIGEKSDNLIPKFDFVSAFDVLFHIPDDIRFETAIANIHNSLFSGGYFIISDNFIHGKIKRAEHQVSRPYDYMIKVIQDAGFEFEKSIPMFVLMNDPVDTNNKLIHRFHWLLVKAIRNNELMGKLIGSILIPIEKLLISCKSEGPSTEIMMFRKK